MKNSIAVLGLGKYGRSLAITLYDLGVDVLVADMDEKVIRDMSSKVTAAVCTDLSNEDDVLALGLQNMDIVIVCMGGNLAASVTCITIAKEKGVKTVIAKASTPRMKNVLRRVGADKVIDPEQEGGIRSAQILASQHIHEYYELGENLCMIEMQPMSSWIGKNLIELELRKNYNMNVAAVKKPHGKWYFVNPSAKLEDDDLLMCIIEKKDVNKVK